MRPVHTCGPLSSTGTVMLPPGPLSLTSVPQGSVRLAVHAFTHDGTGAPSHVTGRIGYQEARPQEGPEETGSARPASVTAPPEVGEDATGSGLGSGGFAGVAIDITAVVMMATMVAT